MTLTARFPQALAYAAELHEKQVRKGGDVPYVAHLLSVTGIVLEGFLKQLLSLFVLFFVVVSSAFLEARGGEFVLGVRSRSPNDRSPD